MTARAWTRWWRKRAPADRQRARLAARARSLALPARECGAVSFIQRFGSALQLNVHFHVLVPEDAEVESLLETFLRRLVPLLERYGLHELEALPVHALDALQLSSAQWKLPLGSPHPPRRCGLRRAPRKDSLTVLDFLGIQHESFRFDLRYKALLGASRSELHRTLRGATLPKLPRAGATSTTTSGRCSKSARSTRTTGASAGPIATSAR